MVKLISLSSESGDNPIAQVHFAFNNYEKDSAGFEIGSLKFSPLTLEGKKTTQYEFKIEALDTGTGYAIDLIYSKALYEAATMDVFAEYYKNIIDGIISTEKIAIQQIDLSKTIVSF